ncbi:MAG: hypothetical protein KAV82_00785 [Phycisphaerae bacterium]|nr:hypothetical protein [Phycisphaerae bacterium]
MFRSLCSILMLIGMCCLTGCGASGGGGGGGVLNQLDSMPDADGDVFSEITPPEGVDFDFDESIALMITNTITRSQAEAAAGVQMPDVISSNISLAAKVAVNLTYADGITQKLPGSFPVGPFELQFEIACPEAIEVMVTVVATAPLVGSQAVASFGPYQFTQDGEGGSYTYTCGSTVSIVTFYDDETGEPKVTLEVE